MTTTAYSITDAADQLLAIQAELKRRQYRMDPVFWVEDRLKDKLWSAQKRIMNAVRDHRRVAVQSCHEIGKSYIASTVAAWWLDIWPPGESFVVTSAPSGPQVKAILWREIGRVHARGQLRGRVNQTEWYMTTKEGNEELVAFGRKPDEYDPTAFQGIHARRVLYIFDEACGISGPLWEAADSLIANDLSKALIIGNPDDPLTEFAENCKPGSGWHVEQIGAFESPNFTGEEMPQKVLDQLIGRTYVEEKRRKWAPSWYWNEDGTKVIPPLGDENNTNPMWQSKVLGEFPEVSEVQGLIPISWIKGAQNRTLRSTDPVELGVDVGGGGDASAIALRKGPVVRIIREDHNPDTMQTCGNVVVALKENGAECAKIDVIGIGRGVVDRGIEQKLPFIGVNVGQRPWTEEDQKDFVNLRAYLWWNVRKIFESNQIDIDALDDDLAAELVQMRFKRTSTGKIQIESKDEAKKRGVASPNRAEALMLALAPPPPIIIHEATWGRRV